MMKNNHSDIESFDQEGGEEAHLDPPSMHLHEKDEKSIKNKRYMLLLVINYISLFVGSVSSSLLSKYYFIHKGSSRWVSTWVQSAGFPLLIIPIYLPYLLNFNQRKPFSDFNKKLLTLSISIGVMLGFNNLLFSWGNSYLPVSTSALLLSTQLVFTLILSAIMVNQKITFLNLNCVILLTLGSVLLALDSSHNVKPNEVTKKEYFVGFICTIGAGLLFALYLPVMEKIYKEVHCYEMVMEMQIVMEIAATALATLGMAFNGGFSQMKEEGLRVFDKGNSVYWVSVVANVVTWQFCFMGAAGMVFLTSALTGGICTTALISMNVFGGVVVFREGFSGLKGVSTVLCLWGFCSYVYGMYVKMVLQQRDQVRKNMNGLSSTEMIHIVNHPVTTEMY